MFDEELNKLVHLEPAASEGNVTRNYLDWLTQVCLPLRISHLFFPYSLCFRSLGVSILRKSSACERDERQAVRDIDMRDAVKTVSDPPNAQQNGYARPSPQQVDRRDEPHPGVPPTAESLGPPVYASSQGRELR